jgi:S-DNA-T family DNA segregation ATPase FtsK/SpoIIIE
MALGDMSDSGDKVIKEALGVLLLALTGLLFISLSTYSPADLMSNKAPIVNYAGLVGALIAHGFFLTIGASSYLIPLLSLSFAVNCFRRSKPSANWFNLAGWMLFLLACCALTAVYFTPTITIRKVIFSSPGGKVGDFIAHTLLLPYLNPGGTYLIIITLLLVSLMLGTGFSLMKLFSRLRKLGAYLLSLRFKGGEKVALTSPKKIKTAKSKDIESAPIITNYQNQATSAIKEDKLELLSPKPDFKQVYQYPKLSLLEKPKTTNHQENMQDLRENAEILVAKLKDFGVEGRVARIHPGPVITRYEFEPAPGIKINKITNLSDDLALAMRARAVRVVAPIPGKAVVGIEIPNKQRDIIRLSEIIGSEDFRQAESKLTLALGKDISGAPYVTDLAKMPHLLIAGATGSGKSVTLNAVICSLLYKASHQEVRLVMLDPKMLELGIYNGIPHLLTPVVTDAKKAAQVLRWATNQMEERYHTLAKYGVRNIDQYNRLLEQLPADTTTTEEQEDAPLPYIVIIIDEFADLMMVAPRDVETLITRIAQMARAVGIHLIIATQRPSVDVITGLIKANFPSRISFKVSSRVDSRTIIDSIGSEKLLGMGDMLFIPPGMADLVRIHGALVTEKEVARVVSSLKGKEEPKYDTSILFAEEEDTASQGADNAEYDEMYDKAVEFVVQRGEASVSMIQRHFRVGYNRAARMVDVMERDGLVAPSVGGKPRKVLVNREYEI